MNKSIGTVGSTCEALLFNPSQSIRLGRPGVDNTDTITPTMAADSKIAGAWSCTSEAPFEKMIIVRVRSKQIIGMEEIIGEGIIPDDDRLSEFLVIF